MFDRTSLSPMGPAMLSLATGLVLGVAVGRLGPGVAPQRTFQFVPTKQVRAASNPIQQPPSESPRSVESDPVPVPVVSAPTFEPETLLERIAERLEALDLLDERIAERERAIDRATRVVLEAQELPSQVQNELTVFQDVILPQMRQVVETRLAQAIHEEETAKKSLDWSKVLHKRELMSADRLQGYHERVGRASAGVKDARKVLERTLRIEHPQQVSEIRNRLEAAKARLAALRRDLEGETSRRDALVRLRAESGLTKDEREAVVKLDEAIRLHDEGSDPELAVTRLHEAGSLWEREEAKRVERVRKSRRDRVARAAREANSKGVQADPPASSTSEKP